MPERDEIPDEVMERAREVASRITSPDLPSPLEVELIARAIMEERERACREAVFDAKLRIRMAFRRALSDLPEIAPPEVQSVLSSVHMRDEVMAEGKRLQREHGLDAVAPRVEQECGAGAWSFMRAGVAAAIRSGKSE